MITQHLPKTQPAQVENAQLNNMGKRIEIIGKKFGKLTAISEYTRNKRHTRVICSCECGGQHDVGKWHLMNGESTQCRTCTGKAKLKSFKHHQWTGCGEISGDFWYSHILRSALAEKSVAKQRKPKELTIDIEYIWKLFLKQNRKCALSGLELKFPKTTTDKEYTASLDRIDSSKGYIPGNVQWVHKHINMMKNRYPVDYFIQMCKEVANFAGGKCEIF